MGLGQHAVHVPKKLGQDKETSAPGERHAADEEVYRYEYPSPSKLTAGDSACLSVEPIDIFIVSDVLAPALSLWT